MSGPGNVDDFAALEAEVDFSIIRYAQCWEDADTVLAGLDVQPGDTCLSISSAGDNTLSLLAMDPARVVAIDPSPQQLACLELRVAAYRELTHAELLELMGARPSSRRRELYARLAPGLSTVTRKTWDAQAGRIDAGIGSVGKFEHYFELIRRFVVGMTLSKRARKGLFVPRTPAERRRFYDDCWDNWRWRALIRLMCSRFVMGRLGRDPRFFKYAEGSVADHILSLVQHAIVDLDPVDNPYMHWIMHRCYGEALPHALRAENFDCIRSRLDRLEWQQTDLASYLEQASPASIHRFNLSDVFEYISAAETERVFDMIAQKGRSGGRIAYWNMLAPRSRPERLADRIRSMPELSAELYYANRTFFYSAFIVEELA